jgi:hypothetical protein
MKIVLFASVSFFAILFGCSVDEFTASDDVKRKQFSENDCVEVATEFDSVFPDVLVASVSSAHQDVLNSVLKTLSEHEIKFDCLGSRAKRIFVFEDSADKARQVLKEKQALGNLEQLVLFGN